MFFYEITFEAELNESDIDFSSLQRVKLNMISSLKETPLWLNKKR